MAKQPPLLFVLDRTNRASLQTQLALNLKRLVHAGMLRPGKQSPLLENSLMNYRFPGTL